MSHLYIGVIVPSTIAVPITVGAVRYRAIPKEIRVLFYYLLTTTVIYGVSGFLAAHHRNNLFLVHADTLIESLFLLWFFYIVYSPSPVRKWIAFLLILFPAWCCINFLFLQSLRSYNTYTRPIEAAFIITLSLLYWWWLGDREVDSRWSNTPLNWIISGLLLYFSSAFLLFVFSNFLVPKENGSLNLFVWTSHATLIAVMYGLFAIGFSKYQTR